MHFAFTLETLDRRFQRLFLQSTLTDFRTMQMLDWFIKEQGEEEKNAADLITKMDLFGGDSKGLYMLNSELKARVYTAPSLVL